MIYVKIKDKRRKEGYRIEWLHYPNIEKIADKEIREYKIKNTFPPRTRSKIIEIWQ